MEGNRDISDSTSKEPSVVCFVVRRVMLGMRWSSVSDSRVAVRRRLSIKATWKTDTLSCVGVESFLI